MKILERIGAWLAWQDALQQLATVVPYRAAKLAEIVGTVAEVLDLPRIHVAHELRDRARGGDDLRTAIRSLAIAKDPTMVEPLWHMWAIWFPGSVPA